MSYNIALQLIIDEIRLMANEGSAPHDLAEKSLNENTTISELGLDSMSRLQLVTAVEDRANVMLADDDLHQATTIGDLAKLFVSASELGG